MFSMNLRSLVGIPIFSERTASGSILSKAPVMSKKAAAMTLFARKLVWMLFVVMRVIKLFMHDLLGLNLICSCGKIACDSTSHCSLK